MGIFDKLKKKKSDNEEVVKEATQVEVAVPAKENKPKKAKTLKEETVSESKPAKGKTSLHSQSNKVLLRTLVSEKAAISEGRGVYTFVVANNTNKLEVKKAVKEIYGVNPEKVRMINVEGKNVRRGYLGGRRSDWKKAVVTLPKGKTINIHEGV